jgi:hypothetical protein
VHKPVHGLGLEARGGYDPPWHMIWAWQAS